MTRIDAFIESMYRRITKNQKIAFISTFIIGLIAHIYMFTNKLPNYDDLLIDSFGATFRLGRWFLWVLGAVAHHLEFVYSLPWINGLISIFFLAVSAMLAVELLGIKSKTATVIISGILVVFPSWTATFFFMFTAPYYAVAVFMVVLSVYCNCRYSRGYLLSIVLLAFSLGIYQAYLPFAATFYVVLLILEVFREKKDDKQIWKKVFRYLFSLLAGVVLYYIIMKLSLVITNQQLADYKGVGQMGALSFEMLPELFSNIINNGFGIVVNNNLEISYNFLLKLGYACLYFIDIALIAMVGIHFVKKRDWGKVFLTFALVIAFIIAVNGIYIICPQADSVYVLMTYAYVFLIIFPVCLLDCILEKNSGCCSKMLVYMEYMTVCVEVVMVAVYCHFANAEYLSMQLSYEQATSYYTTMITQIKNIEGYSDEMPVILVGDNKEIVDETLYKNEVMDAFDISGRDDTLVEAYSVQFLLRYYCGFDPMYEAESEVPQNFINEMPSYPEEGAIQIYDNKIVVKLSE